MKKLPKARILRTPIPTTTEGLPPGEYLLAQLLQNAGAYGLASCRGAYYTDEYGRAEEFSEDTTACCCAIGAAGLAPDTKNLAEVRSGLFTGNDHFPEDLWPQATTHSEANISAGAAFEIALRPRARVTP